MEIADIIPRQGHLQRLYCDGCDGYLDLAFITYSEVISGVDITIEGLPVLRCTVCNRDHLPDLSRFALVRVHEQASERSAPAVTVKRKKRSDAFNFTNVPFTYDPDDYYYIPGLVRPHDSGFLTPVFFNREVLLKYDTSPLYRVRFASTTYGTVYSPEDILSFGINRHGKVVMWLGDIAKMPLHEQYYLKSENIESDHSIGGEFYDSQIECKYTALSAEDLLFKRRSELIDTCFERFNAKIAHLDAEVVTLALEFNAPLVDTEKERRHVADTLNKIYVESFDNGALGTLMTVQGMNPGKLGNLKRLQAVLTSASTSADVATLMNPLYALYDLRVAYSHLTSAETAEQILETVTRRLGVAPDANLSAIYGQLIERMTNSFEKLTEAIKASATSSA
jgi:hypothetical protein